MATYQQLLGSLVDSEDPPLPQRTTSLTKPIGDVRTKHIVTQPILGLLFGSLAVYLLYWSIGFGEERSGCSQR
jgi:hypothetical protein